MLIIGLTGMSGSGKSYVCDRLRGAGIEVINTDEVYHGIISKHGPCVAEIAARFGNGVVAGDGSLNRRALAPIVFSSRRALDALNGITHKYVFAAVGGMIDALEKEGAGAVVLEVPLLFESRYDEECTFTVGVVCPHELCVERIVARDGISRENAEKRLASQHNGEFFREHCDYVICNDGSPDTENQINNLIQIIKEKENGRKE